MLDWRETRGGEAVIYTLVDCGDTHGDQIYPPWVIRNISNVQGNFNNCLVTF